MFGMPKEPDMRIKDVGHFVVFFLLVCSLSGVALEDRRVIQGLLSTLHLNSASEESYEKLVWQLLLCISTT